MDDRALDDLFAAARATPPEPSARLTAQLFEEAFAQQPEAPPVPSAARRPRGRFARFFDAPLWRGAMPAGLAMVALIGIWIGLSAGDALALEASAMMETEFGLELAYRFPTIGGWMGDI
ncbi:MAG: hypothetical protein OIF40_14435 [Mangrovicoccus sp.]|nr:hypothetical protein [Mangrovicoccus sp.]